MKKMMKKRILYATANYDEIVRENGYFVDKTDYIERLETVKNPVFLRPRRFGKTLLCSIQIYYYDLNYADRFNELFAHTWIGQNPTGRQNSYMMLSLNFSVIDLGTLTDIEYSFKLHCNYKIKYLAERYSDYLADMPEIIIEDSVAENLGKVLRYVELHNLPPLYIIIDEYDNFANQLVTANKEQLYRELTADNGFFKTFFKTLKEGRETGAIGNVFITGVLPITMDDMASGFNVASFITLKPEFENMLGFTQAETDALVDAVFQDHDINPAFRSEVGAIMKNHYNGYHLVTIDGKSLYNSTLVMYFLDWLQRYKTIPRHLTDVNLKTELSWVRRLTASNPAMTKEFVNRLTIHNTIRYDDIFLVEKFNMYQFFEKSFFPISFYYLGMLTIKDSFYLQLPNLNMRTIFVQYFNEIHHIDVSTRYTEFMQAFVNKPDLEMLFAGYWQEYISQLPEAVFQQVNENFYRTTFYELCSRYLSQWFSWHVERSYPKGRSDLEFVGKYSEKYAGLRWVIEFKYLSNSEFKKMKTSIDDFSVQQGDTDQINGYIEGLREEYPEAQISRFVIYCFGIQGYRVFTIPEG